MAELSTKINAAPPATTLTGMKLLGVDGTGYKQFPGALFQPYDADLAAIAALSTTSFGRSLLTQADASAARTTLGVAIGSDVQAYDASLAALAALSDAQGVLQNNGSGVLSWRGFSGGGNGSADYGLLAFYGADGELDVSDFIQFHSVGGAGHVQLHCPAGIADLFTVTLPQSNDYLAASPNADGSLSLFNLSNIPADAPGVLTSDGAGNLTWGAGGGGSPFTGSIEVRDGTDATLKTVFGSENIIWHANDNGAGGRYTGSLYPSALTGNRNWALPNASGTLVSTGDSLTVTNAMLAGSIALGKLSTSGSASSSTFLRGDGAWTAVIGGSTGATDNRILRSDGTGGLTLQNSAVTIDDSGNLSTSGNLTGGTVYSNGSFVSLVDSSVYGASLIRLNTDTYVYRDAANIWNHRNGTTAQAWRIANTYTSGTSYEWLTVDWKTTANVCRVMTEKGSGGGSARELHLGTDALASIKLDTSGGIDFARLSTTSETITPNKTFTVKIAGVSVKIPCL